MDELDDLAATLCDYMPARVLAEAETEPLWFDSTPEVREYWQSIATAVRSWLLSEERVEAAAKAVERESGYIGDRATAYARAALSSAIGEPYEFSGWVEVVEEGKQ